MKFLITTVLRFLCLLLIIHLLTINIRDNYYISLIHFTNISKDFDIEDESMPKSKSTETNNDISVDDFFNNLHSANKISKVIDFSETALKLSYHFSINAFPKVHYDIQSPPPRA